MGICLWPPGPEDVILFPSEAHVWCAWLDLPSSWRYRLRQLLSPDELERAERFHFERDRGQFIARRGILRSLLASYLDVEATNIRFVYSDYGKPALGSLFDDRALRFNISHANGLAIFAFTLGMDVGVDVEYVQRDIEYEQLAERYFSPYERSVIQSLPSESRREAFFLCWTRKEAYIKAHGEGLSLPLDQFDVSVTPGEPACLLATRGGLEDAKAWTLQHLSPATGYLGALAVRGHGWRLQCFAANLV
jgi:4'-phosphopantetheinyl transferase